MTTVENLDDNPFADLQSSNQNISSVKINDDFNEDDHQHQGQQSSPLSASSHLLKDNENKVEETFKDISLNDGSDINFSINDNSNVHENVENDNTNLNNTDDNDIDKGDDDDNRSLLERKRSLSEQTQNSQPFTSTNLTSNQDSDKFFKISVIDPQKIGNPANSHIIYTVKTTTNIPTFRQSSMTVIRRYSDFLWLYECLCQNNPGIFIPPPPSKQAYGRFKLDFIEQRRQGLEKCLIKCANHDQLSKDPDLKLFLESDTFSMDVKQRQLDKPQDSNKSMIASWSTSIIGPKFVESDQWFDTQKSHIDSLEIQLKSLVKALQTISSQRFELSSALSEYSINLLELSRQFAHSNNVTKLIQMLADLSTQSKRGLDELNKSDSSSFSATVDEYMRIMGSIKQTFHTRVQLYHSMKSAENSHIKRRSTYEKQKAVGQIHQYNIEWSLKELSNSEHAVHESRREFNKIGLVIKQEMVKFDTCRVDDFKRSLKDLVSTLLKSQKNILESWMNYERELKSI